MLATCCIQPIEMIKVRLQLHEGGVRPTPFSVVRNIIAKGSVLDLYNGLSADLLRCGLRGRREGWGREVVVSVEGMLGCDGWADKRWAMDREIGWTEEARRGEVSG